MCAYTDQGNKTHRTLYAEGLTVTSGGTANYVNQRRHILLPSDKGTVTGQITCVNKAYHNLDYLMIQLAMSCPGIEYKQRWTGDVSGYQDNPGYSSGYSYVGNVNRRVTVDYPDQITLGKDGVTELVAVRSGNGYVHVEIQNELGDKLKCSDYSNSTITSTTIGPGGRIYCRNAMAGTGALNGNVHLLISIM